VRPSRAEFDTALAPAHEADCLTRRLHSGGVDWVAASSNVSRIERRKESIRVDVANQDVEQDVNE